MQKLSTFVQNQVLACTFLMNAVRQCFLYTISSANDSICVCTQSWDGYVSPYSPLTNLSAILSVIFSTGVLEVQFLEYTATASNVAATSYVAKTLVWYVMAEGSVAMWTVFLEFWLR